MIARKRLLKSVSPWLTISSVEMTSIGTVDSVTERGRAREPITTIVSTTTTSSLKFSRIRWPARSSTLL